MRLSNPLTGVFDMQTSWMIIDFEYDDENFLRYPSGNGTIYTIIRAPKRGEMRELVCTTLAGVNGNG